MLETITLGSAVKLATPFAKKIFNSKIKPILSGKVDQYFKNKSDINTFEKESVKYISSLTGQCSTMNTIAFPNAPKNLEELYLPLTLCDESNSTEILIDDNANVFETNNKVLINDTAGMGKSTLSKKIYLNIVRENNYIPVYVELRQLENKPIAEQIASKFGVKANSPEKLLKKLPLVYIFDGLDEVSAKDKKDVIKEIRLFIDLLETPKILITSRQESYLSEFYDFVRYSIVPLKDQEAFSLISKYDPDGSVAKKLINGIRRSADRGLKEFLSTPLYVSLLYCSYRYKTAIPQKKHLFYSQVYEALFDSHDLSKEIGFVRPKHSKLDSSEFHAILRRLGFWCLKNGGKIEFQKDELEIILADIIRSTNGINTSSVNFVKDLTTTVPLFLKEGSNMRWSHKSLMEYFASMFICNDTKEKQQTLLLHLYGSAEWSTYANIFELCADIDFSSLRASVVKEVLNSYVTHYESTYNNITNKRISPNSVDIRIGLSFSRNLGFKLISSDIIDFDDEGFWSDKTPDVKLVKSNCGLSSGKVLQFIMPLDKNNLCLHGIMIEGREKKILDILAHKAPALFTSYSNKSDFSVKLSRSALKQNNLYLVSDDPSIKINNSKYFQLINELLSSFGKHALKIKEVREELLHIATDSSNGIDQLLGSMDC
ncbi:NACHT domain-containing NTPase [Shewanella sp. 10N.286.45.A1]|uniref:NACHT domain-containing protein n=1 Tax=Shewanella sp. 10N.286.45.A1 TaxID=3229694 RepID=UPI003550C21D